LYRKKYKKEGSYEKEEDSELQKAPGEEVQDCRDEVDRDRSGKGEAPGDGA